MAQFLSDPIEAVSIPAARWRISWAIRLANASATFKWCGLVAIYMSSMGARGNVGVDYHKRRSTGLFINNDERTADYYTTGLAWRSADGRLPRVRACCLC